MQEEKKRALQEITALAEAGQVDEAFDLLAQPLHEQLFHRQSFDLLDELPTLARTTLAFDYVRTQVDSGGFIQLIQNGYVSLVLTAIEGFQELQIAGEMAAVLDDVLKVYVLNVETLSKPTSVDEFARLYTEFKEFEGLEARFESAKREAMLQLITQAQLG